MAASGPRAADGRSLVLDGLIFAEAQQYLEAIGLWEQALSAQGGGSGEAAYLCIALLEDHLRSLHEGRADEPPNFREKLKEIGFAAEPAGDDPLALRTPTRRMAAVPNELGRAAESRKRRGQPRYEPDPGLKDRATRDSPAGRPTPAPMPLGGGVPVPAEGTDRRDRAAQHQEPSLRDAFALGNISGLPDQSDLGIGLFDGFEQFDQDNASVPPSGFDLGMATTAQRPEPPSSDPTPLGSALPVGLELPDPGEQAVQGELEGGLPASDPAPAAASRLRDPFDVLRGPDAPVPELPVPDFSAAEGLFDFDLATPDAPDFDIVVDGGESSWEQEDDSGILDLSNTPMLPETDHQTWDGGPWGDSGENPSASRRRVRGTGHGPAFDELELPEDPPGEIDHHLLDAAATHQSLGDYESSQAAIAQYLTTNPGGGEAQDIYDENMRQLELKYLAKLGNLESTPTVALSADQLVWHNLDPNKGFVLSRVDGKMSITDILDLVHLDRHETIRLLSELAEDGIIQVQ